MANYISCNSVYQNLEDGELPPSPSPRARNTSKRERKIRHKSKKFKPDPLSMSDRLILGREHVSYGDVMEMNEGRKEKKFRKTAHSRLGVQVKITQAEETCKESTIFYKEISPRRKIQSSLQARLGLKLCEDDCPKSIFTDAKPSKVIRKLLKKKCQAAVNSVFKTNERDGEDGVAPTLGSRKIESMGDDDILITIKDDKKVDRKLRKEEKERAKSILVNRILKKMSNQCNVVETSKRQRSDEEKESCDFNTAQLKRLKLRLGDKVAPTLNDEPLANNTRVKTPPSVFPAESVVTCTAVPGLLADQTAVESHESISDRFKMVESAAAVDERTEINMETDADIELKVGKELDREPSNDDGDWGEISPQNDRGSKGEGSEQEAEPDRGHKSPLVRIDEDVNLSPTKHDNHGQSATTVTESNVDLVHSIENHGEKPMTATSTSLPMTASNVTDGCSEEIPIGLGINDESDTQGFCDGTATENSLEIDLGPSIGKDDRTAMTDADLSVIAGDVGNVEKAISFISSPSAEKEMIGPVSVESANAENEMACEEIFKDASEVLVNEDWVVTSTDLTGKEASRDSFPVAIYDPTERLPSVEAQNVSAQVSIHDIAETSAESGENENSKNVVELDLLDEINLLEESLLQFSDYGGASPDSGTKARLISSPEQPPLDLCTDELSGAVTPNLPPAPVLCPIPEVAHSPLKIDVLLPSATDELHPDSNTPLLYNEGFVKFSPLSTESVDLSVLISSAVPDDEIPPLSIEKPREDFDIPPLVFSEVSCSDELRNLFMELPRSVELTALVLSDAPQRDIEQPTVLPPFSSNPHLPKIRPCCVVLTRCSTRLIPRLVLRRLSKETIRKYTQRTKNFHSTKRASSKLKKLSSKEYGDKTKTPTKKTDTTAVKNVIAADSPPKSYRQLIPSPKLKKSETPVAIHSPTDSLKSSNNSEEARVFKFISSYKIPKNRPNAQQALSVSSVVFESLVAPVCDFSSVSGIPEPGSVPDLPSNAKSEIPPSSDKVYSDHELPSLASTPSPLPLVNDESMPQEEPCSTLPTVTQTSVEIVSPSAGNDLPVVSAVNGLDLKVSAEPPAVQDALSGFKFSFDIDTLLKKKLSYEIVTSQDESNVGGASKSEDASPKLMVSGEHGEGDRKKHSPRNKILPAECELSVNCTNEPYIGDKESKNPPKKIDPVELPSDCTNTPYIGDKESRSPPKKIALVEFSSDSSKKPYVRDDAAANTREVTIKNQPISASFCSPVPTGQTFKKSPPGEAESANLQVAFSVEDSTRQITTGAPQKKATVSSDQSIFARPQPAGPPLREAIFRAPPGRQLVSQERIFPPSQTRQVVTHPPREQNVVSKPQAPSSGGPSSQTTPHVVRTEVRHARSLSVASVSFPTPLSEGNNAAASKQQVGKGFPSFAASSQLVAPAHDAVVNKVATQEVSGQILSSKSAPWGAPCPGYEYISTDQEENADNFDRRWGQMRNVSSDVELYRIIRQRWHNLTIPNPARNLTCRHRAYNRQQHRRSPQVPRVRTQSCTEVYERRLEVLRMESDQALEALERRHTIEVNKMAERQKYIMNNLNQNANFASDNMYSQWGGNWNASVRYGDYENVLRLQMNELTELTGVHHQQRENLMRQKNAEINKVIAWIEEVNTFYRFYQNINPDSKRDKTMLTEEQVLLGIESDRIFDAFNSVYGRNDH